MTLLFFYSLVCSGALLLMYAAVRLSRVSLTRYGRPAIILAVITAVLAALLPLIIGWYSRPLFVIEPSLISENPSDIIGLLQEQTTVGLGFRSIPCKIYYLGLIFASIRFIVTIMRILRLALQAKQHGDVLISDNAALTPFAWGPWIFMTQEDFDSHGEILCAHESAHRSARHWLDLLFLNLLGCITWFCPAIPLFRRLIQQTHEFEADRAVISAGFDAQEYQMLLISKASGRRFANSVTDSIINHPIKQRIIMMQQKSPLRRGLVRTLALLPVGLVVMALASSPLLASQAESLMPVNVTEAPVKKDSVQVTELMIVYDDQIDESSLPVNEKIFTSVEMPPQYPGGETAMYEFLSKNIRYPKECHERNIQGRVVVSFVVKTDGSIGHVKVVRSVDPQLDGEAVRIVRTFPKFSPGTMNGTPVNVWYTLPINFKLSK